MLPLDTEIRNNDIERVLLNKYRDVLFKCRRIENYNK